MTKTIPFSRLKSTTIEVGSMLKKMQYTNFALRFPPNSNHLEFGYKIKDELTRIGVYPKHVSVSENYLYFLLEDVSQVQHQGLKKIISKYSQSHLRLVC